jgi:hypothetical protein
MAKSVKRKLSPKEQLLRSIKYQMRRIKKLERDYAKLKRGGLVDPFMDRFFGGTK